MRPATRRQRPWGPRSPGCPKFGFFLSVGCHRPALFRCGFVSHCFFGSPSGLVLVWRRSYQHRRRTNNLTTRNHRICSTTDKNQHRGRYKKGNEPTAGAARPTPYQPRWRYNDKWNETAAKTEQPKPNASRETHMEPAPTIRFLKERFSTPRVPGVLAPSIVVSAIGFPGGA